MDTNFQSKTDKEKTTKKYQDTFTECAALISRIQARLIERGGPNLSRTSLASVLACRNILVEALASVGGLTQEEMKKYHI